MSRDHRRWTGDVVKRTPFDVAMAAAEQRLIAGEVANITFGACPTADGASHYVIVVRAHCGTETLR